MGAPGELQWPDEGECESAVMTAVQDFDGYTLAINAAHQVGLQWTRDELSAVPFWELVHPGDRDLMVEDRERLVLQGPGRLDGRRARVLRKDGWYRMIRWDLRAQNQEERIYLTGVDISGSEVLVAPSTRQLVGSWDWDITSDSATWSEGMFEIYGLLPLSAQSLQVALRRIYEDDRAVVAEVIRQALTTGGPYNATHRIVRRDSAIRHLYSAGRIFTGKDGAAERMRGLTWDITDAS